MLMMRESLWTWVNRDGITEPRSHMALVCIFLAVRDTSRSSRALLQAGPLKVTAPHGQQPHGKRHGSCNTIEGNCPHSARFHYSPYMLEINVPAGGPGHPPILQRAPGHVPPCRFALTKAGQKAEDGLGVGMPGKGCTPSCIA